jgi:hypothetical protein
VVVVVSPGTAVVVVTSMDDLVEAVPPSPVHAAVTNMRARTSENPRILTMKDQVTDDGPVLGSSSSDMGATLHRKMGG